ncbi:MAG: homocysteine S-methyltransferase family protein [Spirochaetales bacterium]|nr:homocysteine S-methyltransferase family protein [Spirochaetales bacterium]
MTVPEKPDREEDEIMTLSEYLSQGSLMFLDGAMGTQLNEMGFSGGGLNCVDHPEGVEAVHRKYLEAGSTLLITNSLTINRIYLNAHSIMADIRDVNIRSARIARKAVTAFGRPGVFILGNLGPSGQMLEPYGDITTQESKDAYIQQAKALAEGGVDGFIIETMYDLTETVLAIEGCKEAAPHLPVLASVSFSTVENGGRTVMGNDAATIAEELTTAGASAIGTNCGDIDPFEAAKIIAIYREHTDLPLFAEPNAGKPRLEGTKTVFDMGPDEFTKGLAACRDQGATILGGCCGTTPDHIAALTSRLG